MSRPSPNGPFGRDSKGRFARGNLGGPGNPHAAHVARLRSMLLKKIDADALGRIVDAIYQAAIGGDVSAAKLLIGYALGSPEALDLLQRVETLEAQLADVEGTR